MGGSVTVAVLGAKEIAQELGKKGTQSDLTLYNAVRDGHAATLVEPTQFPEKLAPLLAALGMADRIVFVVPALNREVAETAAAIDLVETPVEISLGDGVGEAEVRRAFRGTRLLEAPIGPFDPPRLRERIDGWTVAPVEGPVEVRIDHAFPVRGVGPVALGVVRRGTLTAHERLRLYPTDRPVEVRSIQVHDVEVRTAATGERVGVALKGVEADELTRGQTLAPEGSLTVADALAARLERPCPYYRGHAGEGASLHLLVGLQFVPVRVTAWGPPSVGLTTDRPVAFPKGAAGLLADLAGGPGPRLVGRIRIDPD